MSSLSKIIVSIIVGIVGYLVWIVLTDGPAVFASMERITLLDIGMVLGLTLVNYALRFLRWHGYLLHLDHAVPVRTSAAIYIAGFALTATPAKAGEAIRAPLLATRGVPQAETFALLIAERLADLMSVALIAMIGVIAFPEQVLLVLALAGALMLALVALLFVGRGEDLAEHAEDASLIVRIRGIILATAESTRRLLGVRLSLLSVLLGVLAWGAEALGLVVLVDALGYTSVDAHIVASIYALAVLAGVASMMPGGLGGTEALMGLLLAAVGLSSADAVSATILCRTATLWFAVVIGAVALGGFAMGRSRTQENVV